MDKPVFISTRVLQNILAADPQNHNKFDLLPVELFKLCPKRHAHKTSQNNINTIFKENEKFSLHLASIVSVYFHMVYLTSTVTVFNKERS